MRTSSRGRAVSASVAAGAAVVVLLAVLCSSAPASVSAASPSRASVAQNKPRTIRGFKNAILSTARNFGKRAGVGVGAGPSEGEFVDEAALQANSDYIQRPPTSSFPVQWFVEEMQNNPELARTVVRKFVDENQDGELSAEELLRPVY